MSAETTRHAELAGRIVDAVTGVVVGAHRAAGTLLAAYLADGHALVEGVPGIGKTLIAQALAGALGLELRRVQLTPDFMPADLIGTNVFDQASGTFRLVRGPVFTQVLLADEINRTPPRTQAALLEAMQERQVTIDGVTHPLDPSFFVVATQNPVEFEGTYPLPEAELDRFLLRVTMAAAEGEAEAELLRRAADGTLAGWGRRQRTMAPVVTPEEAAALRTAAASVHVEPELLDYLRRLARAAREAPEVTLGPSPRALLALLDAARGAALVAGRTYLLPDDVKAMLEPCWGHRLLLEPEAELEGLTPAALLDRLAAAVEVPR